MCNEQTRRIPRVQNLVYRVVHLSVHHTSGMSWTERDKDTHPMFRCRIQRARRLVQCQDRRLLQQRSRDSQSLSLSSAQTQPADCTQSVTSTQTISIVPSMKPKKPAEKVREETYSACQTPAANPTQTRNSPPSLPPQSALSSHPRSQTRYSMRSFP